MKRTDRLLTLLLILLLLTAVAVWSKSLKQDLHPVTISIAFLVLLTFLHQLKHPPTATLIIALLCLVPGLYYLFHRLGALSFWPATLWTLRCCLVFSLYRLLWSILEASLSRQNILKSFLQTTISLGLPFLAGLYLIEENILFLLLLPLWGGLFWYYRNQAHG